MSVILNCSLVGLLGTVSAGQSEFFFSNFVYYTLNTFRRNRSKHKISILVDGCLK